MHDSEHFYSELDAIQKHNRSYPDSMKRNMVDAETSFTKLLVPVINPEICHELFIAWQDRNAALTEFSYATLGDIASFILGNYDGATMNLCREDWKSIAEVISEQAEDINIDTLTNLMSTLLEKGGLS